MPKDDIKAAAMDALREPCSIHVLPKPLRERIIENLARWYQDCLSLEEKTLVDNTLTLIYEEIEKVENPYGFYKAAFHNDGFEVCRQKILSLLCSEK